jgi:hypothetical protein
MKGWERKCTNNYAKQWPGATGVCIIKGNGLFIEKVYNVYK